MPPPPKGFQDHGHKALIIEVLDEEHNTWTAMATEWGRILYELRNAPTAVAITIYEWRLAKPVNPKPGEWARYPTWKRIGSMPWTLDRNDQD